MRSSDACTGEHGVSYLRNHRQVDRHSITLLHAMLFQNVREAADLFVEVAICDVPSLLRRIVRLEYHCSAIATRLQVTVNTVIACIQFAALIPAYVNVIRCKRDILHRLEGLNPIDALRLFSPECFRILQRTPVNLAILIHRRDVRAACEIRWRGIEIGSGCGLWGLRHGHRNGFLVMADIGAPMRGCS